MATSHLRGYFKETRRPIYSAALVLPFAIVYHLGTYALSTTTINGADALILRVLAPFSVSSLFASFWVLVGCFVVWQFRTRGSWTVDTVKLGVTYLESFAFAGLLFMIFGWLAVHSYLSVAPGSTPGRLARLALYCGAGIYEELVFRGALLGGLLLVFGRMLRARKAAAAALATLSAALIFALFHYVGPGGDAFTVSSFIQRTLAGVYFSALFVIRGFGITAAAHAIYDILVGIVLAS